MPFGKDDFNKENAQRLSVIIMPKLGYAPLHSFKALGDSQQKKFNRIMNEYIQKLPDNWQEVLMEDFNRIVNEDILNEDFNAGNQFVSVIGARETILSQEQKEYYADKPEELEKVMVK